MWRRVPLKRALSFTNLYSEKPLGFTQIHLKDFFILPLDARDKAIFSQPFTWKKSWYKLRVALPFHVDLFWACDMYTIHCQWGVPLFATRRFYYDKLLLAYGIKKGSISVSIEFSGMTCGKKKWILWQTEGLELVEHIIGLWKKPCLKAVFPTQHWILN